ncbi:unnamed protein product [Rotaria socialis]|uniref:Glutamine amidotransferase n=1 Tax=Rotaria socialis TaxID=392032 RepID=A0A818J6V4_9BILA|nr:unnamed protein product [Rotaria socialis]CAF4339754.1 unnamed protein product [Rotaria socialis]
MKTRILMNSIKIGITDCARYGNYERWMLDAPEKVDPIRLSYHLSNLDDIEKCHGLILSGGEDVDPRRYKRPDLSGRIELTDIDEKRDDFEIEIIKYALQLKLPILAICRGMQLFNVYHGGTLLYDIPSMTKIIGHAKIQGVDQRHDVFVRDGAFLKEITGCLKGAVNSAHHQCIEKVGANLAVVAKAEESVIEAIEWKAPCENPYFLGVQWHPERMIDQTSPFSCNIRQAFLDSSIKYEERILSSENDINHKIELQDIDEIENKPPLT